MYTEAFTNRKHLHNDTRTQTVFHTQKFSVTQKSFYTQNLLHTKALTHSSFYTQVPVHTQKLLHTGACRYRSFYAEVPLHIGAYFQANVFTQMLLHTFFETQKLLHTHASTRGCFYTQKLPTQVRHNQITTSLQFLRIDTQLVREGCAS